MSFPFVDCCVVSFQCDTSKLDTLLLVLTVGVFECSKEFNVFLGLGAENKENVKCYKYGFHNPG